MEIKGLLEEDLVNYKVPCMTIMMPRCSFKCDKECGEPVCQNSDLASAPNIEIDYTTLISKYKNNPITQAICLQGLEPFDSWTELHHFISAFRGADIDDDIVIYTGYTEEEISNQVKYLQSCYYKNIIIKFGRFIPNQKPHYDEVLGVKLASDNQYAKKIS